MKIKISVDGYLFLDRGFGEKSAACPYARAANSPPDLPVHTRCGDWCALFGEWAPDRLLESQGYLQLCGKNTVCADALQDDRRVPEPTPAPDAIAN